MQPLNPEFWNDQYRAGSMGWDIGYAAPPLTEYIDQIGNRTIEVLVPGAGNAYEVEYLHRKGFDRVTVLDWSAEAIQRFRTRVPDFPRGRIVQKDFFTFQGQFDLILEQTFFSALEPQLRPRYAKQMHALLKSGGRLVGVLFSIPLYEDHPPFGGSKSAYIPIFEPWFEIEKMEECYNSIPPRAGNELFINLKRKMV